MNLDFLQGQYTEQWGTKTQTRLGRMSKEDMGCFKHKRTNAKNILKDLKLTDKPKQKLDHKQQKILTTTPKVDKTKARL